MDSLTIVLFLTGFVALIGGAELLVRGASRLAVAMGISPLVVGLTVVAFGTSSPELAVSVLSSGAGQADIAIGNVVGSNIFNVLFILGLSAMITPLVVSQQLVRLDVPLMICAALLLPVLGFDGRLGRLDGVLLFGGVIAYTVWAIRRSRKESAEIAQEYDREFGGADSAQNASVGLTKQLLLIAAGLGLLMLGSNWLVDGAVSIARAFGVSELIIGLTIIAAGTGAPEVATSVMASLRGERDIAVGNVVGSNLFNILAVLGLTSLVAPAGVAVSPTALAFDIPVMIAVCVACLPIFFTGHLIARWEGAMFFAFYLAYTAYLILGAMHHARLEQFSSVMLWFVLPLTAVTIALSCWRALAERKNPTP